MCASSVATPKGQRPLVPTRVRIYDHENRAIQSAILGAFGENLVQTLEFDPVGRLGWSGVRVYRVRAMLRGTGPSRYFYAKVGREPIFENEDDSFQLVRDELRNYAKFRESIRQIAPECFEGAEQSFDPASEFGDNGRRRFSGRECRVLCIAYSEAEDDGRSLSSDAPPLTLHDHLEKRSNWEADPDAFAASLSTAIKHIYDRLRYGWRGAAIDQKISWSEAYCKEPNYDYLRLKRLTSMIEASDRGLPKSNKHRLVADLKRIRVSAERVIEKGPPIITKMRPVHGDLHQRNIIVHELTNNPRPWLIDFGWTKMNHAMIDFALLETSLTNFFFAQMISDGRLQDLRDNLIKNGASFMNHCTPIERAYVRTTRAIREAARLEASNNWPDEYFLSSLLITVGLTTVPTARIPTLTRHALWFAEHLKL